MLDTVLDARASINSKLSTHLSKLRICLPISFAQSIAPKLSVWLQNQPNIQVDVLLSDRFIDLSHEQIDLAIRFDKLEDSRLIAKALPNQPYVTCASPSFLSKHPINNLSELKPAFCLGYLQENQPRVWQFQNPETTHQFLPAGQIQSNQGSFLLSAAINGSGVMQGPKYLLDQAIKDGELVPLLEQYHTPKRKWWLVYPQARKQSKA